MKYYNIEIFKASPAKVPGLFSKRPIYDAIMEAYSPNDRYFLTRLHGLSQTWGESYFRTIMKTFYVHFNGDPRAWLEHTASIIHAFNEPLTNHWIEWQIRNPSPEKKRMTGGQIVNKHYNEIKSKPHGEQKKFFKKLSDQYATTPNAIKQAYSRKK